jgi:DNA polymerase III epsilon subunit-like protein
LFPWPVYPAKAKPAPKFDEERCYEHPDYQFGSGTPFREAHLIENLSVKAADPANQVLFYTMLNQGNKRGKETKILSLDCERILTKKGDRLARISIVNFYGNVVFDTLVKPWAKVEDYREWITGIKPDDLKHAPSYPKIAPIVSNFCIKI